uniref:Uncharacterized protein n=1 Tax=uncultured Bacillota bacterium TaxID=344338 RepID=A0A650EN22_9FIRM|nr:hypothetical protein Firmicute1046_2260 [uncultured Firmicutes bacterium]
MNINIDKTEVLRYLGCQGQTADEATERAVEEGISQLFAAAKPRYTYRVFETEILSDCEEVRLNGSGVVLRGKDIVRHLAHSPKCALLGATLGIEADNLIRVAQNTGMLKAVVLDACATDFIEKVCDEAEKEITALAEKEGYQTTFRYSPGYGDLPLEVQPAVCAALDTARRIGVTVSDSLIMIPRKSVTAIIGFTTETAERPSPCETCTMRETCEFRKRGTACGR